ncbi:MAG TPA: hypothetical protein EYN38_08615 [Flavobacteriales bacterium]|nr:hypothetical protein [Flavobacteriales bacterium]
MKNEINPYFKLYGLIDNDFKKNFMKMLYIVLMMSVCISFSSVPGYSQDGGVGINTLEPDTSAALDIVASRKGLLIPRLEQGVVDTGIVLPANGLMIFNTTTNTFQFNSGTPSNPSWGNIGGSKDSWLTGGNTGTSPSTNFIGTGDNTDLSIQVDSTDMIRITTSGFVGIANSAPVEALDVGGGIKVGFTANANEGTLRWTGSDLEVYDGQNSWLSLTAGGSDDDWTVSGNYVYNLSDSIGIGTSAPSHLLNVLGGGNAITGSSVDVSELSTVLRRSSNVNSNAVGIGFGRSTAAINVGAAIIHERKGSTSQGNLHFATKGSTSPGADIPIRMTITKDGDVLIGDQFSKQGKEFEITGSAYVDDTLFTPNVSGFGAYLDIQTNGTSRIRILDTPGTVGIGTTAPNTNYQTEITTTSLARNLFLNNDYGGSAAQYAVVANMSNSGTGTKVGYYVQGEDYNYFSGNVGVGTTAPINKVDVEGAMVIGSGFSGTSSADTDGLSVEGNVGIGIANPQYRLSVDGKTSEADVAVFNRINALDGYMLRLRRNGGTAGGIMLVGGVVSLTAFTGAHLGYGDDEYERGMLISLTGNHKKLSDDEIYEPVYEMVISAKANDPKIIGTYQAPDLPGEGETALKNQHTIMACGNGDMFVVDNGKNLEVGDYLISSDIAGCAMLDNGEFEVAYIIARVAEPVNWDEEQKIVNGRKVKRISIFFESFVINYKADRLEKELSGLKKEHEIIKADVEYIKSTLNLDLDAKATKLDD